MQFIDSAFNRRSICMASVLILFLAKWFVCILLSHIWHYLMHFFNFFFDGGERERFIFLNTHFFPFKFNEKIQTFERAHIFTSESLNFFHSYIYVSFYIQTDRKIWRWSCICRFVEKMLEMNATFESVHVSNLNDLELMWTNIEIIEMPQTFIVCVCVRFLLFVSFFRLKYKQICEFNWHEHNHLDFWLYCDFIPNVSAIKLG